MPRRIRLTLYAAMLAGSIACALYLTYQAGFESGESKMMKECAAHEWANDVGNRHKNKMWLRKSHVDAFMAGVEWVKKKKHS